MATTNKGGTNFPFPHSGLTPILGKPTTITAVKQLQKEVYANTVPSTAHEVAASTDTWESP
jgi:hypothetical protein